MKKLSTFLFLIFFSFSALSFADDISDLKIEGISIGDSLLDYFSEEEIKKEIEKRKYMYQYTTDEFGEVYNMGSEGGIKIYALAELIGELMGHESVEIEVDEARVRPWEIWHLQSDNTKLYNAIGKREPTSLREALQKTIDYFRANGSKWDW